MLLKGKMFSLHILQYQSAPVWTAVNSSPENGVQFLCTFRWQQLQCIKYEWFRIFLSQMGQVLFWSSMVIYESLQYICSQKNIALVAGLKCHKNRLPCVIVCNGIKLEYSMNIYNKICANNSTTEPKNISKLSTKPCLVMLQILLWQFINSTEVKTDNITSHYNIIKVNPKCW